MRMALIDILAKTSTIKTKSEPCKRLLLSVQGCLVAYATRQPSLVGVAAVLLMGPSNHNGEMHIILHNTKQDAIIAFGKPRQTNLKEPLN